MPTTTKNTRSGDGPRAALARLEDARTLLTTISTALETEIARRTDDVEQQRTGWTHYGDAARLHEDLKAVAEQLQIQRNEVEMEHACPGCHTRDADRLLINDDDDVRCTVCGCEYSLD